MRAERGWLMLVAVAVLLLTAAVFLMQNKSLGKKVPDLTVLDGVWRSQGYGWLWAIADGQLRTYQESGAYCIETPDARQTRARLGEGFNLSADGSLLKVALYDPAYQFAFEK